MPWAETRQRVYAEEMAMRALALDTQPATPGPKFRNRERLFWLEKIPKV